MKRRPRGPLWHSVAGNRGQAVLWLEWDNGSRCATSRLPHPPREKYLFPSLGNGDWGLPFFSTCNQWSAEAHLRTPLANAHWKHHPQLVIPPAPACRGSEAEGPAVRLSPTQLQKVCRRPQP